MLGIVGDTGASFILLLRLGLLRSPPIFEAFADFTALARQMDTINLKTAKLQAMSMTILRSMNMVLRVLP